MVSWSVFIDHSYISGTGRVAPETTSTSRPVCSSSAVVSQLTSPRVALMMIIWAWGSSERGTCQAQPRSGSAMKWNSSMITWSTWACDPSRSAMFAKISAVQQMMGADALTEASPVTIPTFCAPNISHRAKNFSETRALIGAV